MKITWLGTASILIEAEKEKILFDPFVELAGGSNPNTEEDFKGVTDVCITHGHVDHLFATPQLIEEQDATVHCPAPAAATLEGWLEECGNVVRTLPGESWRVGGIRIRAHRGAHVPFTPYLAARTLFQQRNFCYLRNALFLAWAHPRFPEKGETLVYEVEAEGKRVLLLGSMALDSGTVYPEGADLLILPFQGRREPEKEAGRIVERLKPKRVLLDHFDDAFPPVSRQEDTRGLYRLMQERFPQVKVVKPKAGKSVHI